MQPYSFLISVYVKEKPEYLKQSLDSMIAQTVKPQEIVLVEDGPLNDGLYEIIDGYNKEYPDLFNIVKLKENKGLGNALNEGLKVCKTELVARMDSDDICLSERCEKQLKAFDENPEVDILGAQINEFMDTPDNIISSRIVPKTHDEIIEFSKRRSPFNHPTVMFKKSAVLGAGGYGIYGRKEDLELFIKMVHTGYRGMNLDEALLLYRTSNDNLKRRKTWQNCREYIEIMYKFYKQGYSGFVDIAYVVIGQMTMFLMPEVLLKRISDKFLRNKKQEL